MKIDEIILGEANTNRKIVGQAQAATNLKANREKSAAWTKQMKATSAETEAPAAAAPEAPATKPAVQRPKADPFAQMVNQLQPPQKSSTGGTTTQIAGGTRHTANPNNPNLKQPEAPAAAAEKPAAGVNYGQAGAGIKNVQATPQYKPGLGKKPAAEPTAEPAATAGKPVGIEKSTNLMAPAFLRGMAKGMGDNQLAQTIDTAAASNVDRDLQKKQVGAQNAAAGAEEPAAEPGAAKPGAAEPGKSPVGQAGAGAGAQGGATPAKAAAAGPVAAKPVAATAKTMSKEEILAWISRHNDPDMVKDLIALKTGITAAEKGAPTAAAEKPAAEKPAAAATTSYAPKVDATAAASGYGPKQGATSMNTTVNYPAKATPAPAAANAAAEEEKPKAKVPSPFAALGLP